MAEQLGLGDILGGSDPDGKPLENDPVARQQAERNAEPAPATEAATDAPETQKVERSQSRRKAWQQKERDTREAAEGRVRDPETGQYVAKAKDEPAVDAAPAAATPTTETPKPDAAATPAQPAAQQPAQPQQQFTEKERAFLAAAQDERRKRQALEQQLAALQQQNPQEKKTFWDDPEAALQQFQQQITQVTMKTKLDTSESIARGRYKDFEENVQEFAALAEQIPGVREQMMAAPDPAEFAYQVGKRQRDLKQIGDIEEYRAKVERETRARLEAEYKAKAEEREKLASDLTPSLSDARGSNPTRPVFSGPPSLDSILSGN